MTFRFIADHADEWPVAWMCEALEVSASGYYAWAARADSPTAEWRQELVGAIADVHAEVRQRQVRGAACLAHARRRCRRGSRTRGDLGA